MKTDFSSPVATAEFSKFAGILSAALSQHHFSRFPPGLGNSQSFFLSFFARSPCCMRAFSSCGKQGLLLAAVHRLLIVVASLGAEHRL